jgi:hypothetical protein
MDNVMKFPTPEERTAKAASANRLPVETTIEPCRESTMLPPIDIPLAASLRHMHSPALFALPFVTLPAAEYTCWGDFWKRTVMWNDEPTEDSCADYQRGRGYAREAVAAIVKDAALSRSLRIVVETILERAFRRRGPRGGLCRQISSAEDGFLTELVDIAVAGARHLGSVPSTDFR